MKPYQLEHLETLLGGDAEKVQQFVGILLTDLPAHVSEMQRLLDEYAWQDVSLAAHGIKVQLKYLAADEAGTVAGWIEREAGQVSLAEIEVEVARLERMITDICTDLKRAYQ